MSLVEFVQANITSEFGYECMAIMLGIIFIVVHDFYHAVFGAIVSWFKK